MRQKPYRKPKIHRKKITIQFFTRKDYYPSNDMDVMLLAQGSSAPCILPDTKILMADKNQIAVSTIKEGDRILSFDKKNNTYSENIVKKIAVHTDETSEYYLINSNLSITGNHLLLVNNTEWKMVKDLQKGDIIHRYPNEPEKITEIELVIKDVPVVYNLQLEKEPGNYIADGICIHW